MADDPDSDVETTRERVLQLALENRLQLQAYLLGLCRDMALAEDLFQETLLVVCQKWNDFTVGTSIKAWMFAIARNLHLRQVTRQQRHAVVAEAEVLERAFATRSSDGRSDAALREALVACWRKLPERNRKAFYHRFAEGSGHQPLGARLGLTDNALYLLLSRTRKMLRACIHRSLRAMETRA
ncbi:MAG: RNA polymerase sigma factor [Planctomycetota bacterium]